MDAQISDLLAACANVVTAAEQIDNVAQLFQGDKRKALEELAAEVRNQAVVIEFYAHTVQGTIWTPQNES